MLATRLEFTRLTHDIEERSALPHDAECWALRLRSCFRDSSLTVTFEDIGKFKAGFKESLRQES